MAAMQRKSLSDYFDKFHALGAETAYIHRSGYRLSRWSYREVAERAAQFARELEARSIHKGDAVMIWGENRPEWAIAFIGCVLRGAVVVPMDRIATADFAARVAAQVNAKLLVCSGDQPPLPAPLPTLPFETLTTVLERHATTRYPTPALQREDLVEIVFTSGTTAEPKGVVLNHGNVLANLEPLETEIAKYIMYERLFHPLRFLNLLPLSHVFGQFLGLFVPPLIGATVLFQDSLNPSEIFSALRRERVSVIVAVPRLLESLRAKIERDMEAEGRLEWFRRQRQAAEGENFIRRWWRFRRIHNQCGWKFWAFISGGAALDADTEAFWSRLSFVVIQGYGLTETTSLISVNHPFKLGRGSIGKVLPGREVKVDESGEILVRGENIATAYWQGKQLQPVLGQEGWFHTGDMGEMDAQGNLYFKGRKKSVIVTPEGMNVYPEDLEAALRRQPEVREVVVIGLRREGNAEPCAALILHDRLSDPEPVIRRANKSLAGYQQIRHWMIWPEEDFPRTSTQKPRTHVIQEAAEAHFQGGRRTAMTTGTLADLIQRVTGRPVAAGSPDANPDAALSLSSLERVELLSAIEDRYQVDINESRFTTATTVAELERMLQQPGLRRSEYHYPRWPRCWPMTWIRPAVYYSLAWPATWLLAAPQIRGREHLDGVCGPALVVCNHITSIDVGFILAGLSGRHRRRLAVAMEGERLEAMRRPPSGIDGPRRWIHQLGYWLAVGLFNVFPLPQKTGFRESFAFIGETIDRNYSVLVFPEGERTKDGRLAPFRTGIGLLANNLRVPVIPMHIGGLFELKQARRIVSPQGQIQVTIGAPMRFDPQTDPAVIARRLQETIAALEAR